MQVEFDQILRDVRGDDFWPTYLTEAIRSTSQTGVHLAVFAEPFLSLVLSGRKTIESRFSRSRCAPYGQVREGDVILMKEVGGPIRGIALAHRIWSYDLKTVSLGEIKERFGTGICGDDLYWDSRTDALYATLIELDATLSIPAARCNKRDRRGWVSLRSHELALNLA